ncbi:hypothetical protein COW99_02390 [Candidatus Roizmanbacteria bacterium CG22_combo_CG10-13_8_21_14_all_38_20]|uniref:Uncharacterized protein n=1 Tax=Candidatus Roizmanbacteria bacterium CG22_combo_CG10-13_8_21_14_all_38_20 TaxID=1974862 RepID=A0A2H0BVJ8_9BACT|nr:hypothetical protein [Candidatus Microgenomates bacterium]PIP61705.1 MAG: hypothetical protein COW99_02390 [Candidatus Roizmanbacteria bacterium CG22_combo_CG10-13_8_21_14_all_38_20]PJC32012.1 MAG: hypothetical protein CO050_00780 [Candidatus Roizmanbacteria bacterium CG_4_9_14_0_2_um_filter_38_17]
MPKGFGTQVVAGILGLLFVVGLVLLGRRLGQDLRTRFFGETRTKQQQITPTPADIAFITPTPGVEISGTRVYSLPQNKSQVVTQTKGGIQEIPKTGAETLLLSSLLLPAGWYIRRKI